ncbi:hypothetical protein TVAG_439930 [Trichomonas vaginalis G3]|uniref:DUF7777 domain-containing protein n=2 Tax=Trichomonas vaginalis (strain ATCC PRA-98 / G3) TaxID=412133 RepID=A2G0F0_TRIV3|nr:hypothetical protein TVAGG3_0759090 [Trichomonas vaginalis G3]XP_001579391.2 hypothetical protein TVAGG3_0637740 [Trichomonas vaginalis G3]XP_051087720.1 hypothetical protein TVAGG3_0638390 [Trichomonas vaginalis G3]EAX89373.1 hypothetical protein TVAG_439930 [Trichomonas vaginalis G3]KAI5504954.1 hypothetical protein TVAGG3_0637740 [Trichomonas vaginalis G3]KAI5504991.1 hypothetical protein TVAGG3_0638390 [Trichomonas vaginalis G3]KAI5513060.1 hypothetical protein TVAGG3_0759090 [Trichomo|eukprot:XP_001302303.1 hypothetical protein [Trichomonas vaginalis G3]
MLPIEKENSRVATTKPLDELFTNVGQKFETETVKHEGYRFDYPLRWLRDPSVTKAIGFRRMKFVSVEDKSFPFIVRFHIDYISEGKRKMWEEIELIQVDLSSSLQTALKNIEDKINSCYAKYADEYANTESTLYVRIVYDKQNSQVSFQIYEDNPKKDEQIYTEFTAMSWYYLQRMLNQKVELPLANIYSRYARDEPYLFKDVFDSDAIIVHASFSGAQNSFLCLANDFYEKPTKLYEPPSGSISDFQVWFTTDGRKRIIPLYHAFYLELSFIYNYYRTVKI